MLAALLATARRGAPIGARAAAAAARAAAAPALAPGWAGAARRTLASLTRGGSVAPLALAGRLATPSLLPPLCARTLATKQPKAGGAKMKSLSCWKRRFKVGAAGLVRMRAGHRHKRAVKPPHVRRRLRSRTAVHGALAKKMVVRGFTRERLC